MLDFVIFAITFLVVLIAMVFYLYPGSSRQTTIPGMDPSDPKDGNLIDVANAGGFHPFLKKLHDTYGPISGFWNGEQYTVSLASPELWKEHIKVFDRPASLFKPLEPLIGVNSIQFANGADGRKRRKDYDRYFSHSACKGYFKTFRELAGDITKKWASLPPNQHIPLHQYMMALAIKGILLTGFGTSFRDENMIVQLNRLYDYIWNELSENQSSAIKKTSANEEQLEESIKKFHSVILEVIRDRNKASSQDSEMGIFIDFLLAEGLSDEQILSDAVTYIIGGFHTTGNLLTWALYFISTHEDVQEKLYNEFSEVLGKEDPVDADNLGKLTYTRQVIDESMRCSVLAPYAARCQDLDVEIGGHIIPKGTPVVHALGVVLHDTKFWPDPSMFDPDRFSEKNQKIRPPLSFSPFGFAGQRVCPAQKFAYVEVTVYLSIICRKFKLRMVEGQVVVPRYTLVSRPDEEIWITISPRG